MILYGTHVKFEANKQKFEGTVLSTFQTLEGGWMTAVQCGPNSIFMIPTHKVEVLNKKDRPVKTLPALSTEGEF